MPDQIPRRLVTFTRADGKSYGKANLDECDAWVQTKYQGSSVGQDTWDLYQSNPEAWEGEPPPPPVPTRPIETMPFHHGNIEPTLYRTLQGAWFRRLWFDEYARGGLEGNARRYTGLTEEQAHEWLQFNGYGLPEKVVRSPGDDFHDIEADMLPIKGEPMSVAEFERLLWDVEQLHERAGYKGREWGGVYPPAILRAIHARDKLMHHAPGFKALKTYLNVELGQYVTKKALEDFVKCLARKLRKPFDEVERLTIEQALAVLNESAEQPAYPLPKAKKAPAVKAKQAPDSEKPTPEMFRVYHATQQGVRQQTIASQLGISQATVSRYRQAVLDWIKSGGVVPNLDEVAPRKPIPKVFSTDPRKMGRYTQAEVCDLDDDE